MATPHDIIKASAARHMLLHAQGLYEDVDQQLTPAILRQLILKMGYIQLDSINIIERAHHLTLLSRFANYKKEHLKALHEDHRALFEHWTHDASILPVEFFAPWHHRRIRFISRPRIEQWINSKLGHQPEQLIEAVLKRIEDEGPLQSRDFQHHPKGSPGETVGGWWGWKPAKAALEFLWWQGELGIASRKHFQKFYDLNERLHPEQITIQPPDEAAFVDWVCEESMKRLVFATATELRDFFHTCTLQEVRNWIQRQLAAGSLVNVLIEPAGSDRKPYAAVALSGWKRFHEQATCACETIDDRIRLLSPFDPVIRNRERAAHLFDFEYRFEAFVPAAKRRFGYYVLPMLQNDRLIGRCDLKLHRKESELEVKNVWWENHIKPTKKLESQFENAIHELASFVGADFIVLPAND